MSGNGKLKKEGTSNHKFQVGDVVLAKIKGFPSWPGVLVGDDQVPKEVLAEKPKDKFIIRFFPKADYQFPSARDLSLLTREECQAYIEDSHRKENELKEGFRIAADPAEWIEQQDEIVRESEKAKQEAELEEQENEDQLAEADEDDEDDVAATAGSKKRASTSKPTSSSKAKKTKTEGKATSVPRKSAGADEEAGEDDDDAGTKRVRGWRHSLQRAFLPKDRAPTEQDVESQDQVFTVVEKADITAEQLRETKIGKVMRKIVGLEKIPLDEVHHFRERAEALLARWAQTSQSGGAAGSTNGGDAAANDGEGPAKNGHSASSEQPEQDHPGDLTELNQDDDE